MRLLTFCVCASSLLAQGGPIVVVDAANGPGTNFVDVQAAVLAAPDGSVLLVRPGAYAPVTIDGKGVTVVAESSFTIQGSLSILNTNAQQRVVVRGFVMGGFGNNVVLSNAAGPVTLDAVGQSLQSHGWGQTGLIVSDCQQVVVRNGTVVGTAYASAACWVTNSSVVFENCALRGSPSQFTSQGGGPLATPALVANASTVQLVDSSAEGGAGAVFVGIFGPIYLPAAEAVVLQGGSLRATGLATHFIAGGMHPVRAGGCGRVDGVARRVKDRAGGSRVVRDRCLNFLRARGVERWAGCLRAVGGVVSRGVTTCVAVRGNVRRGSVQ